MHHKQMPLGYLKRQREPNLASMKAMIKPSTDNFASLWLTGKLATFWGELCVLTRSMETANQINCLEGMQIIWLLVNE